LSLAQGDSKTVRHAALAPRKSLGQVKQTGRGRFAALSGIDPQEPSKNILALSHGGAILAPMEPAAKSPAIQPLDRINLRLPAEVFEAIDATRARRPGTVSRNTWITEAIQEKLLREGVSNDKQPRAGESNGRLL
jgi:hypothetical protein